MGSTWKWLALIFLEARDLARLKRMPAGQNVTIDLGKANPKQAEFYESRTLYTCYGGARGGGKSHAVRTKAVLGCLYWAGIKVLILRRTYPDLENSIVMPLLQSIPQQLYNYNATTHLIRFTNGSTIKFGHFQGHSSAAEYQGQEYDWIFIDEATQFTEMEFRIMGGCLRGTSDIPKRMYLTCNPGGVGHQWVKRLFIDRKYKTNSANPEENENPDDYKFIFATVEDNQELMKKSPQYLQMLSALPEHMRAAHRYGDWDALGGAYFPEFGEDQLINDFSIPDNWVRYRSFDYGLDMLACFWIAIDESDTAYVYREAYQSNLVVSEAADLINAMTPSGETISITFAPPDMWTTLKDTGKTMAEIYMNHGVYLVKAPNNRVQGWMQLKEYFYNGKMKIFRSCTQIIDDLKAIQSDERNPNDCAKEPHEVTHGPDGLRYFAASRTLPAQIPEEEPEETELTGYEQYMTGGEATRSYITC